MKLKHHKGLSVERWRQFSLEEQMANIGSEVFRSISWRDKDTEKADRAFERSLELFDLSLAATRSKGELKELCRARECWADYFFGDNQYNSTKEDWQKYFYQFTYLARNIRAK